MINGSLKNKINSIWQDFYNENMAQTSDIVNQLTTLMFIKMLDDKQNAIEARASILQIELNQKDLTFKKGNYKNYEMKNGEKVLQFEIPYNDLRWKNFKNLNPNELAKRLKNYVFPFIKDENNESIGKFPIFATKLTFAFDYKERLLTSVVDKLSDEEFNFSNNDLMGDVYEYMCGSGVSGQYRTPRHIINMAIQMMRPKIGDKIIDPAMGTAGFIIESAMYIKENERNELMNLENQKLFNQMFYGCDNDDNMARIGYMNCLLHGIKEPNITIDSLLENENLNDYIGKFDLVLANPPFSGSLVESATNGKILNITNTKKTELLFVALMILLLKPGGRCMTIVPDGVLFGTSNAGKQLRIELIDKQKLIAIISMPSGIFSASSKKGSASKGAGVKTSFIIFEKTNKGGTDKVWFYDMKNDGFTLDVKHDPIEGSNIPDIVKRFQQLSKEESRTRKDQSFFVPVDEIRNKDYDLSINNYKDFENEKKEYRSSLEILNDIKIQREESDKLLNEIKDFLLKK